jgi:uncharacterized protein
MKKNAVAFVDRLADDALKIVYALNAAFFLSFLILLVALSAAHPGHARAAELPSSMPRCTGKDLIAQMAVDAPSKLASIRKEADAIANGSDRLWKVEKANVAPSYLFGTMHVTDERVASLSPEAQKAFETSKTLVIETTDVLDPKGMMAPVAEHPDLMMFTDGTTLETLLTPAQLDIVKKGLADRGLPLAAFSRMKPWILSSLVAVPPCEMARKQAGAQFLDIALAEKAKAAGKSLKGLETAYDQLHAMASLPLSFHIEGLVDTLKLAPEMPDVYETMIDLYVKGEIGMIMPFLKAVSPDGGDGDAGYAAFQKTMVEARNVTMADHARPILDAGNAFVAVGAEHLVGDKGLVALLRADGYTVTPLAK